MNRDISANGNGMSEGMRTSDAEDNGAQAVDYVRDSNEQIGFTAHPLPDVAAEAAFGDLPEGAPAVTACPSCGNGPHATIANRCARGHQWPAARSIATKPDPDDPVLEADPDATLVSVGRGIAASLSRQLAHLNALLEQPGLRLSQRKKLRAELRELSAEYVQIAKLFPTGLQEAQPFRVEITNKRDYLRKLSPATLDAVMAELGESQVEDLPRGFNGAHAAASTLDAVDRVDAPVTRGSEIDPREQSAPIDYADFGEDSTPRLVKGAAKAVADDAPYVLIDGHRVELQPGEPNPYPWLAVHNLRNQPGYENLVTLAAGPAIA
jgi:hypothetical protein